MTSCPKCGAQVASEAALCNGCGAPLSPSSAATPVSSMLSFIHSVSTAGQPQQRLVLVGGALAVIGSFLPFYVINLPQGLGSAGSFSFMNTGFPGGLALLVACVLSLIGILPAPSRVLNLLGLGLATLVLGMLLYAYTASGFEPAAAAAALLGRGIGFYMLGVGYVVLEYVYIQRVPR
jgi:hypothetical protein